MGDAKKLGKSAIDYGNLCREAWREMIMEENTSRDATYESLPLERLKTEAERWIAGVTSNGSLSGAAAKGVRDIVQQAFDLGKASPSTEECSTSSLIDDQRNTSISKPRAIGVSRMSDNDKALLVCFARRPTDDELRALHDLLAGRGVPSSTRVASIQRYSVEPVTKFGHDGASLQYTTDDMGDWCKWEDVKALLSATRDESDQYPDAEADGVVFCGKCGSQR